MADEEKDDRRSTGVGPAEFVHPQDAAEHGYYGRLPHTEDPEAHTLAAVVGGTANVADQPSGKVERPPTKRAAAKAPAKSESAD
jgi:hypothetical protein